MRKWVITKEFAFCYGHRVWSQKLNQEYSIDNRCVCRHLHGHQGKILVNLVSEKLESGMVTDFKHLNWFKQFLDDALDHKFIVDKNDPGISCFVPETVVTKNGLESVEWLSMPGGYDIILPDQLNRVIDKDILDILEGYVRVDFVPTSENLSEWLHGIVQKKMDGLGIKVKSLTFYETPKSSSLYES